MRFYVLALFLSIALVLGLCPGLSKVAYAEEQTTVTTETTVQQDEKTAPDDQTQNSQTVDEQENSVEMPDVVASGAVYHDALGAGSYAAAKKEFILLVNPDGDNFQMVEKAKAHGSATILGGLFAVPAQVEADLNNAGVKATRIAGDDAYEKNVKFVGNALKVGLTLDNAGFSSGLGCYDALVSSHILGKSNSVMFLVSKDESLNQKAYDMLKKSRVPLYKARVFGGQAVITDETVGKI